MPSYCSNLKNVYKRTYEELKNPKSPIGIFLEKIDDYEAKLRFVGINLAD